jgi:dinuclear metal center YbgI/SA1388 family protein
MADLREMVSFLDTELNISAIKDYPGAVNGLQLENDGEVKWVISAVDASLAVVEEAAQKGSGLLLVHHGLFWQGAQPLTGNLAIYSSHLPLDVHPVFGNNVLLAEAIGLSEIAPIWHKDGFPMGVSGIWTGTRTELSAATAAAVGREIVSCPGSKEEIRKVAVITGGAGSEVKKIAQLGMDAFVTGEGPHWSFIEAEELGLNVLYAGHYATETFGVRQLGKNLAARFHKECLFIERPGGL